jgi:TolC family type I secretion outer membrane protein
MMSNRRSLAIGVVAGVACLAAGGGGAVEAQSLEEALAEAYARNPTLLAERAALRAVDEGVPKALSGWRPTVSINSSVGRRYQNNRLATGVSSSQVTVPRTAGLSVSQPLYRGGATVAETNAAENRVLAGRANLIDVEQQVLLEAATAYMNVVRDQSVVELSFNNEQVLERQLQAARDRFEVGEVTRTDVSQAEARLADASASRIEAEGNLEIARANYQRLVGSLPGVLSFPDLAGMVVLPDARQQALVLAEQRNPAVLRAGFLDRAALYDISAAGALLLPRISLDGTLQRSWEPSSFFERSDTAQVTANLTVPLYQSGAEYARVRELRQVAVQRRRELDDARRRMHEAIGQTWERLETARARIRAFESSVRANEIALEGVSQEAAVGARTVLDVLDAEQELFSARVKLVRAEADEVVASFDLLRVAGANTARDLRLPVQVYDPSAHYDEVHDKWIGFGGDYEGGELFDFDFGPD